MAPAIRPRRYSGWRRAIARRRGGASRYLVSTQKSDSYIMSDSGANKRINIAQNSALSALRPNVSKNIVLA